MDLREECKYVASMVMDHQVEWGELESARLRAISAVLWHTNGDYVASAELRATVTVPLSRIVDRVRRLTRCWPRYKDDSVECADVANALIAAIDNPCIDVLVRMYACFTICSLYPNIDSVYDCRVFAAGQCLVERYPMDALPDHLLLMLWWLPWPAPIVCRKLARHMSPLHGAIRYGQPWDRQAHILHCGQEVQPGFVETSMRMNVLFATLLLAFGRFEGDQTIAVAHSAMLEDMLELVPLEMLHGCPMS